MSAAELTTQVMPPSHRSRMRFCKVAGCFHVHNGKGLCTKHRQRLAKYGDPLATLVPRKAGGS